MKSFTEVGRHVWAIFYCRVQARPVSDSYVFCVSG